MRFDVNISVARSATELGKRAEIKNLNSFRSVERACSMSSLIVDVLERGEKDVQGLEWWQADNYFSEVKEDAGIIVICGIQIFRQLCWLTRWLLKFSQGADNQVNIRKIGRALNLDNLLSIRFCNQSYAQNYIGSSGKDRGEASAKRVAHWLRARDGFWRVTRKQTVAIRAAVDDLIELAEMTEVKFPARMRRSYLWKHGWREIT